MRGRATSLVLFWQLFCCSIINPGYPLLNFCFKKWNTTVTEMKYYSHSFLPFHFHSFISQVGGLIFGVDMYFFPSIYFILLWYLCFSILFCVLSKSYTNGRIVYLRHWFLLSPPIFFLRFSLLIHVNLVCPFYKYTKINFPFLYWLSFALFPYFLFLKTRVAIFLCPHARIS